MFESDPRYVTPKSKKDVKTRIEFMSKNAKTTSKIDSNEKIQKQQTNGNQKKNIRKWNPVPGWVPIQGLGSNFFGLHLFFMFHFESVFDMCF